MRRKFISSVLILTAAVILGAACNAVDTTVSSKHANANKSTGPEIVYPDGARRITTGELEALLEEGKVYLVDVRSQDSYDIGHIPGARLIPSTEILNHINELPRDKIIVTYCS